MSKLSLFAIIPLAVSISAMPATASEISPINLVFNAYQGYFVEDGVPGGSAFIQKVHLKQIDAETLVQSAIDKQRLSPEKIQDRNYLNKIKAALFKIERRR